MNLYEFDDPDVFQIEKVSSSNDVEILSFKAHTDRINAIAISDEFAVSGSSDQTLCVWNWRTGQLLRTLQGHVDEVITVAISDEFAVSGSSDKTLRVWNWKTGQYVRTFDGPSQRIEAIALQGHVVAAAAFGDVWVWNWKTGEHLRTFTSGHKDSIRAVALRDTFVLSAADVLLVRDWTTGQTLRKFSVTGDVDNFAFAFNGDFAVCLNSSDEDAQECELEMFHWTTNRWPKSVDIQREEYQSLSEKIFVTPSHICIYRHQLNKWYVYTPNDGAYNSVFAFTKDYSHFVRGDKKGIISVVRTDPTLQRLLASNPKLITKGMRSYNTDDVLQAIRNLLQIHNQDWVNFAVVSQHLDETFYGLKSKPLGHPAKKHKSLVQFLETYPFDFELRPDDKKKDLYWIRLKKTN